MKIIFHLDFDSYFVSAERTINKSLIGKPAVVSNGEERSIISAASYEAKKQGVYVPMPLYLAKRKVSDLIVVKPNFELYTALSSRIFENIFSNYTSLVEVTSIDECYMDVTNEVKKFPSPIEYARLIQKNILKDFGIPVSIGISNNKFVAKMSTQINKPFGITFTPSNQFLERFGSWDLIKFHGIGQATAQKLKEMKILTIKDLAQADPDKLEEKFGILGKVYIDNANGNGSAEIDMSHNELKGIGHEITLKNADNYELKDILEIISSLIKMIEQRLLNRNLVAKVIAVYVRYEGTNKFKRTGAQITVEKPISSHDEIFRIARGLFEELYQEKPLRLIGVRTAGLSDASETTFQVSIFDDFREVSKAEEIIKKINSKAGKKVLILGEELTKKDLKNQHQKKFAVNDRSIKHLDKKRI